MSYKSHFVNVPTENFISTETLGIDSGQEIGSIQVAEDKAFVLTDIIISPPERWDINGSVLYHIIERSKAGAGAKRIRFAYCANAVGNWCHNFTTGLVFEPNTLIQFRAHRISMRDGHVYFQLLGYYANPATLL